MRVEAAVVREQGVDFVVVSVKRSALAVGTRDDVCVEFSAAFEGLPAVLMSPDSQGVPEYYGRRDIVDFLSDVPPDALPWAEYTLS